MNSKRHHTPEGVRDIIGRECEQKQKLEETIQRIFKSYGYRMIETPSLEYFDVFGSDIGTIPSRELFKFFDREGETLVLRPDFTPSIARAVSRYYGDEYDFVRLCYRGKTWVNQSRLQGRLAERTEMGAELMGVSDAEADAEVTAMAIESLLGAGLKEFQITMGNARFLEALFAGAGLTEEQKEKLRSYIGNRNSFGAFKLLSETDLPEETKALLGSLPFLSGTEEVLEKALAETGDYPEAASAIRRLIEVYDLLRIYGLERYVSFDLGMVSSYMYYTGIIFRGYTYGTGDAIIKGGRYDNLMNAFGVRRDSTGFVIQIDSLMNALQRQKIHREEGQGYYTLCYERDKREEAIKMAVALRKAGFFIRLLKTAEEKMTAPGGECTDLCGKRSGEKEKTIVLPADPDAAAAYLMELAKEGACGEREDAAEDGCIGTLVLGGDK